MKIDGVEPIEHVDFLWRRSQPTRANGVYIVNGKRALIIDAQPKRRRSVRWHRGSARARRPRPV